VMSLELGKPVAMGYLRRELARVGARAHIQQQQAEVIKICGN
jgi:glycine cleavage system aminomethyltransferase T